MNRNISRQTAQKTLALIWFSFGALLFITIFLQTILGYYDDRANEVWSWFLPTTMPTLSLIAGVLAAEALGANIRAKSVDVFIFNLSLILSVVYLLMVSLVIFLKPVLSIQDPLEVMRLSNLGLGPFQGLVSACIGIFFIKDRKVLGSGRDAH